MGIVKTISILQIFLLILFVILGVLAHKGKLEEGKKKTYTKISNFSILILLILFPIKSKLEPPTVETNPKKIIETFFKENDLNFPKDYEEKIEFNDLKQATVKSGDEEIYVYIKDNKVAKLMLLPSRYFIYNTLSDEEPVELKKDLMKERSNFRKSLSTWDVSNPVQVELIKRNLSYPDSYKHVESKYFDYGNYYIMSTTFKAKNSFGMAKEYIIKTKYPLEKEDKLEILSFQ